MKIKNIVFDIGNVVVKWAPFEAIQSVFSDQGPAKLYQQMWPAWIDLNLGKLNENEIVAIYQDLLSLPKRQIIQLMHELTKDDQQVASSLIIYFKTGG